MKKTKIVLASALLALAMVLSMMALPAMAAREESEGVSIPDGVRAAEVTSELPADPTSFTMAAISEPDYVDPAVSHNSASMEVFQNTYETLIWYDGESAANLVPLLATEVPTTENGGISADGMSYTFHIRDGVTFHDGKDLTAEDVAYSVQRVLRIHDVNGPSWIIEGHMTCYLSFYIDGVTTVGDWAASEDVPQWLLDGAGMTDLGVVLNEAHNQAVAEFMVQATGEMTVQMRLVKPYAGFVQICAHTVMSVVSKDYVEANGGIVNGQHNLVMDVTVCGTGPYELAAWDKGVKVLLSRNPEYWGSTPALQDVNIVPVLDTSTRASMLQDGTADSAVMFTSYEYLFADDPDFEIVKGMPEFTTTMIGFNMEINAVAAADWGSDVPSDFFVDREVRQAFVNMFNYSVFYEMALAGNAIHPNGPIPVGMSGYDGSVPAYDIDLEAARDHLRAAINPETGNSWWEDGFSVALFYNAGNVYRQVACQLLDTALYTLTIMAMDDTGAVFDAVINELDWPTYLMMLRSNPCPFPMFYFGWSVDYADPDNFVTPFLHSVVGTFTHSTGYVNTTLDQMIEDAAAELDEALRADLYHDISMAVFEDAPYLWLWQSCNFHVQRSWVDGYSHNPMHAGLHYASLSKGGEVSEPVADFVYEPAWPSDGMLVTFRAEGSYDAVGIASYAWDFGDGSSAEGYEVTHRFVSSGKYTVTLTVTNVFGLEASASETVKVKGHSPSIYGTVLGEDLEPLEGASVRLYSDGVMIAKTTTDASGEFAFYGLEPDDYRVTVSMSGLGATSVSVMFTGDPVDVGVIVL